MSELTKKGQNEINKFNKKFEEERTRVRTHDGERYSEEYKTAIAKLCVNEDLSRSIVASLTGNTYRSCKRWDFLYNHGRNISRSGNSNKVALEITNETLDRLENSTKEKINILLLEDVNLKEILTNELLEKLLAKSKEVA